MSQLSADPALSGSPTQGSRTQADQQARSESPSSPPLSETTPNEPQSPRAHAEEQAYPALSPNQGKVIRDKYLRDAPNIDAWLRGVARNIALAEVLYDPHRPDMPTLLAEIDFQVERLEESRGNHDWRPTRGDKLLLNGSGKSASEREQNFHRFVARLDGWSTFCPKIKEWEDKFFDLMRSFRFLPNSPTLMNAGRELQQLAACYVLPVGDSIEEIFEAVKNQALIHKSGGGTGFSFGRLRPAHDRVKSTQGLASGPLSFMKIFDAATEQVKQGGTRRGANMAILPYHHPDILNFISAKSQKGTLENFNLSVGITRDFIEAARADREIDLINPHTGETVRRERAKSIWEAMCRQAWKTGDPGYVVLDRINESESNTTPHIGLIEATNPCGEQPLLPNEPCNLGSINLARFVKESEAHPGDHKGSGCATESASLDEELKSPATRIRWDELAGTIRTAVRFLDNVIDMNHYPTVEIEQMAKGNRRIGLGIMGLAEFLVQLDVPYDSPTAVAITEQVMEFISRRALIASELLAEERGVFPHRTGSVYDTNSPHFRGTHARVRHSARTTIAPTGTIAIAAGLQGSGIEPFFAVAYTRYNAKGLDALRRGETPDETDTFHEVNPLFRIVATENKFFGMQEDDLWRRISENHGSVRGIHEIPESVQTLFATSHDVPVEYHVRMQAAAQKYTDNAVSKTINLPHHATVEQVSHAFVLAYDLGCKGLTVYRDRSKEDQILNLTPRQPLPEGNGSGRTSDTLQAAAALQPREPQQKAKGHGPKGNGREPWVRDPSLHRGTTSVYYEKPTGYGPLHVTIIYDTQGPYRVFCNIPPMGTEISGLTAVMGILLSKYLETGGDPARILKHLNSIKGDRPHGFGAARVDSIAHALAECLKDHLIQTGRLTNGRSAALEHPSSGDHGTFPPSSIHGDGTNGAPKLMDPTDPRTVENAEAARLTHTGNGPGTDAPWVRDPWVRDPFCASCYSRNVSFVGGCKEPTCADCGFSNCG